MMIKEYTNGKWRLRCGQCNRISITIDYNIFPSYMKCMCCGYKSLTFKVRKTNDG